MGYADESRQTFEFPVGVTADPAQTVGDSAVFWDVTKPITLLRVGALVSTVLAGTAGVVKFDRRITTGSDTGRGDGDLGVLTTPDTTAAGKVIYKDVAVDLNPGDQIMPEITTGQGTSGAFRYFAEYVTRHEVAANLPDMVASV